MESIPWAKPRIIHIDDDGDFLELFSLMLESRFDITSTKNGQLALELLDVQTFSAVVADYQMPLLNGIEILKIIKEKHPELPVIIYTGQGNEEVARQAFLLGASDYFIKDFLEFSHREQLVKSIFSAIDKMKKSRMPPGSAHLIQEPGGEAQGRFSELNAWGFALADWEGRVDAADQAMARLLGVSGEELQGALLYRFFPEDDELKIKELFNGLRRGASSASAVVGGNNKPGLIMLSGRPISPAGGRSGLFSINAAELSSEIINGITDSLCKKAPHIDEPINKIEKKFHNLVEATQDLIFISDLNGRITFANASFGRILKMPPERITGRVFISLIVEEDRSEFSSSVIKLINTGNGYVSFYARLEDAEGEPVQILFDCAPLMDDGGKVTGITGVGHDVTPYFKAKTALKSNQEYFNYCVDLLFDEAYIIKNRQVAYCNMAGAKSLGFGSPENIMGKDFLDFVMPDRREEVSDFLSKKEFFKSAESPHRPILRRIDGHSLKGGYSVIPIINHEGETYHIVIHHKTGRINLESRHKRLERKISVIDRIIDEPFWVISSRDYRFCHVSPAFSKISGYDPNELVSRHLWDITEENREEVKKILLKSKENVTDPVEIDISFIHRDGGKFISKNFILWDGGDGKSTKFIAGVSRPFYKDQETGCRLQYHTTAMEASMDGIAILDPAERYFYLNTAHARIYGYDSPDELMGKTWRILYDEDEIRRFEKEVFPVIFREGRWMGEGTGRKKDGTLFAQEVSLTALDNGGLICIVRDTEERKKAENQLKRERDITQKYFDTAGVMMMILSPKGIIRRINRKGMELLGASEQAQLAGRNWFDVFIPEENRAKLREAFLQETSGFREPAGYQEVTLTNLSGEEKIVSWFSNSIAGENGRPEAVICSAEDITLRKRMEQELIDKNRELNDFVYMVSHDLKNPVNIIKGFLSAVRDNRELFDKYFDRIINQSNTLISFIDNLLKLSRAGRVIGAKQEINSEQLLRQAFIITKPRELKARLEIAPPLPSIYGDQERISQVFTNLIQNAFAYRDPEKEELTVKVYGAMKPGGYEIIIEDNGLGIEKNMLKSVFEAGVTLRSNKGTGFGLPIARKIIEAHGGAIRAESEGPGRGSRFVIRIPRHVQE